MFKVRSILLFISQCGNDKNLLSLEKITWKQLTVADTLISCNFSEWNVREWISVIFTQYISWEFFLLQIILREINYWQTLSLKNWKCWQTWSHQTLKIGRFQQKWKFKASKVVNLPILEIFHISKINFT